MKSLKKIGLLSTLALMLPLCIAAKGKPHPPKERDLDAVAAVVNDKIITESEVQSKMDLIRQQLLMTDKDIPDDVVMHKKVLNMMIDKEVQMQIADRADIKIDIDELNQALQNMAARNHISLEQMRTQVESDGMSYSEFRKNIREQLRLQKLQSHTVGPKVTVTEKEVTAYIKEMQEKDVGNNQYHLANILISLPAAPTSQQVQKAQKRADAIMARLNKGEKFSTIASKTSDGDKSLQGGDLGWRKMAEIPDIFLKQIKTMKEGDFHGPIRAPNGFHIIKLLGIKNDVSAPSKQQVKAMIYNRKLGEKIEEWVKQMRDGAYVKMLT